MGFRVETGHQINEADVVALTTGNILLAQAIANHANQIRDEQDRTNKAIFAAQPMLIKFLIPTGTTYVLVIPTINSSYVTSVNEETVKNAMASRRVSIEYTWPYLATAIASKILMHMLEKQAMEAISGEEDEDPRKVVLSFIADALEHNSPVLTGTYQNAHILFADGKETDVESIPDDVQEFVFMNDTPYARKIEMGLSKQTPEGVYEGVASIADHEYGDVATITFDWRSPPEGVKMRFDRTPSISVKF